MPFSVLMSLYSKERADYLRKSLSSIFNQTLRPDEVVLVLDGPITNELQSVVNEFNENFTELKIIPLEFNQGLGFALNEGLKNCTYDLVARMDTDDIAKLDRFEKQVSYMYDHSECDVLSSWIDEFENDTNEIISVKKLPRNQSEIYKYGKKRCPINHPVSIFRKSKVLDAGGYKPLYLFEDYYLWARMLVNGSQFHNLQESLLYFRSNENMYKRRGGLRYFKSELNLLKEMHRIHYISSFDFVKNLIIRFTVRMMPNTVRKYTYKALLRRK